MIKNVEKVSETGLLIVGGGGAAAVAALEASRQGLKPLIVCKDTFLGGATIQATGGTVIPFLPEDSPDAFISDTLAAGGFLNNRMLVKALAEGAKEAFYDLEREGFLFDRSLPSQLRATKRSEGHSILRSYADRRQNHGISNFLKRRIFEEEIPVWEDRILVRFFVDEGQILGGLFFSLEVGKFEVISSRVVILATGGLGQLYSVSTNANCLTGEGYAIAFEAGAELVDMEMVQFIPFAFPHPSTVRGAVMGMCSAFGEKVKLYNSLGERYMERYAPKELEYATRDVVARANYLEIQEGRGTRRRTIIVDPTENDRSLVKEYQDSFANIYVILAEAFGEKAANWEIPFEAIPAQHFIMGGIRINEHCRTSVQNLLCCGEASGGVHGANRLAGNALTEIYVFGKRAGQEAVDVASDVRLRHPHHEIVEAEIKEVLSPLLNSHGIPCTRLRQELQKVMWDYAGIVRDGDGLNVALRKLDNLKRRLPRVATRCKERRWNREWLEVLELSLMIRTTELIATSASVRRESRGSHYRKDFPAIDPGWLANIVLSKDNGGRIKIDIRPVQNLKESNVEDTR